MALTSAPEALRRKIAAGKTTVKEKFAVCKVAAKKLETAYNQLLDADSKRDVKNNAKTNSKYMMAEKQFDVALREFAAHVSLYDAAVGEVLSFYDELEVTDTPRAVKRIRSEAERFDARERIARDALVESVDKIEGVLEALEREESKSFEKRAKAYEEDFYGSEAFAETEEKKNPEPKPENPEPAAEKINHQEKNLRKAQPEGYTERAKETGAPEYHTAQNHAPDYSREPQRYNGYYAEPMRDGYDMRGYYYPHGEPPRPPYPQGIPISPVSIDISPIVEDAVAMAIEKFKAVFNKRVDAYIKENESRLSMDTTEPVVKAFESETKIADNESVETVEEALGEAENSAETESVLISDAKTPEAEPQPKTENGSSAEEENSAPEEPETETVTEYCDGGVLNTECEIFECETKIAEKVKTLLDEVKLLLGELMTLNRESLAISEKQKSTADMQKQINTAQRALSREIQGMQATLKVINEEQKEIIAGETEVVEGGKKNLDAQRLLLDAQRSLSKEQESFVEAQSESDAKMKEISAIQKEILSLQSGAFAAAEKTLSMQRALAESQTELTALQRSAISSQKQINRTQRSVNERVNKDAPKKSAKKEASPKDKKEEATV